MIIDGIRLRVRLGLGLRFGVGLELGKDRVRLITIITTLT